MPTLKTVSNAERQTQNASPTVICLPENNIQRLTQTRDPFCLPHRTRRKNASLSARYANRPRSLASAPLMRPWWWAPPRQGRGRLPRAAARGRARRSATGRGRGFGAAGPRLLAALGSSARAERIQRESAGKRGRNRGRAELGDWQQPWWCPAPATVDGERGWCSGTGRRRRSRMAALGGAAPAMLGPSGVRPWWLLRRRRSQAGSGLQHGRLRAARDSAFGRGLAGRTARLRQDEGGRAVSAVVSGGACAHVCVSCWKR